MTSNRLAAPQFLRGAAALLVMLAHWSSIGSDPKHLSEQLHMSAVAESGHPNFLGPFLVSLDSITQYSGFLNFHFASGGVLIFFLISGFVIGLTVEKYSPLDFGIRRVFRLLPPLWMAIALWLAINFAFQKFGLADSQPFSAFSIITNALLVHDWFWIPHMDPSFWTLLVEVKFYLIMAALVAACGKLTPQNIFAVATLLLIVSTTFFDRPGSSDYAALNSISLNTGLWWPFYFYRIMNDAIPFIIFMLIGSTIYLWWVNRCTTAALAVFVPVLFGMFALAYLVKPNGSGSLYYVTDALKVLIVFLAAIGLEKRHTIKSYAILKPLAFVFNKLGDISYPLYLIHGLTGMSIANALFIKTGRLN